MICSSSNRQTDKKDQARRKGDSVCVCVCARARACVCACVCVLVGRQTGKQTGRQADRQTGRDRQAGRQAGREAARGGEEAGRVGRDAHPLYGAGGQDGGVDVQVLQHVHHVAEVLQCLHRPVHLLLRLPAVRRDAREIPRCLLL